VYSSNDLPWVEESKCVCVRLFYKSNFWETGFFHARLAVPKYCEPPDPENLKVLLDRLSAALEPYFHMVNTYYPGIPIGMAGGRLSRKHHDISMASRIDSVIFAPKIVGGIVHLHSLD
jgi:hypothetical protein